MIPILSLCARLNLKYGTEHFYGSDQDIIVKPYYQVN